ncbi:MAG: hypothetical protein BZ135_09345 [Methanosphaera sp. rholeuAM6]|nr:MAG: hypothetical protein BZ135_09345 [Methanosphaera sp. rholeuAM6]
MMISLIKRIKGTDVIKELTEKYGSKKELERLYESTKDVEMLVDLENWRFFLENPNETLEKGESIVTNKINLTEFDFEILSTIKYNEIKSIRDLANILNKDVKSVQPRVHKLSEGGFIHLAEGNRNSKIPLLNYDEIKLEI